MDTATSKAGKRTASRKSADTRDGYEVTEQVGHLLRKAYQRHLTIFAEHAKATALTSVQFVTLCILQDRGDCSQAELVRATAIDQATIRGVIDRLATRGLIVLKGDAHDGRKVVVGLTTEGHEILQQMYPAARAITEATLTHLNPTERVALDFLLRKMMGEQT